MGSRSEGVVDLPGGDQTEVTKYSQAHPRHWRAAGRRLLATNLVRDNICEQLPPPNEFVAFKHAFWHLDFPDLTRT